MARFEDMVSLSHEYTDKPTVSDSTVELAKRFPNHGKNRSPNTKRQESYSNFNLSEADVISNKIRRLQAEQNSNMSIDNTLKIRELRNTLATVGTTSKEITTSYNGEDLRTAEDFEPKYSQEELQMIAEATAKYEASNA